MTAVRCRLVRRAMRTYARGGYVRMYYVLCSGGGVRGLSLLLFSSFLSFLLLLFLLLVDETRGKGGADLRLFPLVSKISLSSSSWDVSSLSPPPPYRGSLLLQALYAVPCPMKPTPGYLFGLFFFLFSLWIFSLSYAPACQHFSSDNRFHGIPRDP